MRCKYCGQRLSEEARRCPICRAEFTEEDRKEMAAAAAEEENAGRGAFSEGASESRWKNGSWTKEEDGRQKGSYSEEENARSSGRTGEREEGRNTGAEDSFRRDNWAYEDVPEGYSRDMTPDRYRPMAIGAFAGSLISLLLCLFVPYFSMGVAAMSVLAGIRGLKSGARKRAIAGIVIGIMAFLTAICYQVMLNSLSGRVDWDTLMTSLESMMEQSSGLQ